jgi:pilus assembly protein Flp/PilA
VDLIVIPSQINPPLRTLSRIIPEVSKNTQSIKRVTEFKADYSDVTVGTEGTEKVNMKDYCSRFWRDTEGQDLVEYALAAGLVAVAAVAAMPTLSTTVNTVFTKIA